MKDSEATGSPPKKRSKLDNANKENSAKIPTKVKEVVSKTNEAKNANEVKNANEAKNANEIKKVNKAKSAKIANEVKKQSGSMKKKNRKKTRLTKKSHSTKKKNFAPTKSSEGTKQIPSQSNELDRLIESSGPEKVNESAALHKLNEANQPKTQNESNDPKTKKNIPNPSQPEQQSNKSNKPTESTSPTVLLDKSNDSNKVRTSIELDKPKKAPKVHATAQIVYKSADCLFKDLFCALEHVKENQKGHVAELENVLVQINNVFKHNKQELDNTIEKQEPTKVIALLRDLAHFLKKRSFHCVHWLPLITGLLDKHSNSLSNESIQSSLLLLHQLLDGQLKCLTPIFKLQGRINLLNKQILKVHQTIDHDAISQPVDPLFLDKPLFVHVDDQ
ncbi:hypothetical protein RFI_02396 [Reticulomyxa filosa]|uniref:Small-subunit processome Utp12 domain-containing protein n=1 Tax=Reticulomyxa filosa TaxID=46433 RepID=X6P9A3_RETFI|nr:hypothetical protein RFI_02396 [Reticulomyxa filosa]|eukprot:ETO34693.1 hypothetical protein RFI_02396 [Reticulomyxa filosa]